MINILPLGNLGSCPPLTGSPTPRNASPSTWHSGADLSGQYMCISPYAFGVGSGFIESNGPQSFSRRTCSNSRAKLYASGSPCWNNISTFPLIGLLCKRRAKASICSLVGRRGLIRSWTSTRAFSALAARSRCVATASSKLRWAVSACASLSVPSLLASKMLAAPKTKDSAKLIITPTLAELTSVWSVDKSDIVFLICSAIVLIVAVLAVAEILKNNTVLPK